MTKLSVVIPVYNEKNTILQIVDKVKAVNLGGIQKEIIIIDDCSTDGTKEILKSLASQYKVIFKEKNGGKGSCVKLGFELATGDMLIIQDADLEYDPNDYPALLQPILLNQADVVFGTRLVSHKPHRVLYFWHYVANKFLTTLSNMFTNLNLSDMEAGYKVFNRKAIDFLKNQITAQRFSIEPQLVALAAKNKLCVYEVGISYFGRTYAEGKKINWKDGIAAFFYIFKYGLFK